MTSANLFAGAVEISSFESHLPMNDQLREILSWRLVTELWRRFPDRFHLIETHPGGGLYDCLSFVTRSEAPTVVLHVNRAGSVSASSTRGGAGASWSDWTERLLGPSPVEFVDEVTRILGFEVPHPLPPSVSSTITFRFITEFLTHSIGRLESWECRNGLLDSSGMGGGVRQEYFDQFPHAPINERPARAEALLGQPAYQYWFLLRDDIPWLCLSTDGVVYRESGTVHNLFPMYQTHRAIWPLIMTVASDLLP